MRLPAKFSPPISDDFYDLHGRVEVDGECLDWLDPDTRQMVQEAIARSDTDDIEAFSEAVSFGWKYCTPLGKLRAARRRSKMMESLDGA